MPLHTANAALAPVDLEICCHNHQEAPTQPEETSCELCDLTQIAIDIPQPFVFPNIVALFSYLPVYTQQSAEQIVQAQHQARAPPFLTI